MVASVFVAFLPLSIVVAILSWFLNPFEIEWGILDISVSWGLKPLIAPMILFVAAAVTGAAGWSVGVEKLAQWCAPRLCLKLSFSLAVLLAGILLAEGCLKLAGYEAKLPPIVIQGEHQKRTYRGEGLVSDLELRWKFKPGEVVWGTTINQQGFRDHELAPKPEASGSCASVIPVP